MSRLDAASTAAFLMKAWKTGEFIGSLPGEIKPITLDEGYEAQDCLLALSGNQHSGWKLGVGSPAAMQKAGLTRPLVGQLTRDRCHKSCAELKLPTSANVTVECEIAFILARDVSPAPGQIPVNEDIRHICVSFELVRSRFIDRSIVGWPSFVADNVGFEALIVSEPCGEGLDLDQIKAINDSVVVYHNGEVKAKALSGDAATNPVTSLSYLYQHASERGLTLRAGEIVTTGAMCTPFDIPGVGQSVCAKFLDRELNFSF